MKFANGCDGRILFGHSIWFFFAYYGVSKCISSEKSITSFIYPNNQDLIDLIVELHSHKCFGIKKI